MSSLLRDLTDMGIAVNPDVQTGETVQQSKSKVVSIFESHWDKEGESNLLFIIYHLQWQLYVRYNWHVYVSTTVGFRQNLALSCNC